MDKKYGALSSSVDSRKLSMTIKGVLKSMGAIAIILAPFINIEAAEINNLFNSLDAFMSGIDTLIVSALGVWGLLQVVIGTARKVWVSKGIIKT